MQIPKIRVSLALLLVLAGTTGCDKFLDTNTDPINPIDVQIPLLLPTSQAAMATGLGHSVLGLSQPASAIMQQLVNTRVGAYFLDGNTFNNQWQGLYVDMLANNELIIKKGTASGSWAYVGIAQIQKAYVFSQMVDVWGDIPYSEALQGADPTSPIRAPKFDKDEDIYRDLFRLIDEGITNLGKTSTQEASTDDLIYRGDKAKWIRLGNTLKLKLYNQIRLTRNVATEVTPLLATNANLITAADDFEFRYGTGAGSPENRHPGFQGDYAGSSRENSVNLYFYNLMKATTDPRIPYYFFNQVTASTPLTTVDYQDGRFITTRFGSVGPQSSTNNAAIRTLQGLYPIGGRYDNGAGIAGGATGASAKGDVAQRFITFFMRKYTEAELQLMVLNNAAAARTALSDALNASFAKVNAVAVDNGSPVITAAAITTYVTAALARYDAAASNDAKLNVIISEKYIASFGTGVDVYTDYRRTGYPNIPNAATDSDPQTVSTGDFPVRFTYRANDLLTNPNAPQQPNYTTAKIFWDR
ncbi:SusD/RagB family nutrient-binding outer membrane lipoprotein [Hymenobacter sp. BT664]|uniref:SusD/RagB family nutrient-binding outer membrane lipoprotein n=1 Tax=Hymenobacter montanus TaxID=2771359 RepID=A0A927BCF1_9BACT|nr:SusD/RagB family nutrient-binding outer membrane lipoprotein [Hymenobacter montanus]MBD2768230.1 SusD/RagB family nutrient-binding outer membrane lipoprotein [Hymenobacter montanus]